jgi:DNA-binding transcriptional ArsR family regulator
MTPAVPAITIAGEGRVFAALADDTRRTVLDAVARAGSTTATALAEGLPITRQAVAKHLAVLETAGLVSSVRVGRETRYAIEPGGLAPIVEWTRRTEAAWSTRLGRLRARVEGDRAR